MIPQLVRPKDGDPYYNRKTTGGYNPCILGNPIRRVAKLNVLPNCVGYAVGRFNAIGDYGCCKYLGNTNASNFIDLAKRQGLQITQEPTLGGCMVWSGGDNNYGHAAIVEMPVNRIGVTITSESEYYGKAFTIYARSGEEWADGCYWMGKSYKYLGCIKNPAVTEEMTEDEVKKLIISMFPDLFREAIADYFKTLMCKPADDYAEDALKWAKDNGIMIGNLSGNQMPQSPIKRQDLVCVLYGMEKNNGRA